MHPDLNGFYGSPVSYALCVLTGIASSVSVLSEQGHTLLIDKHAILQKLELWRLLTSQFTFLNGVDASIALFLLYRFRFLERHMGSRKFGTLALLTVSMTALYIAILLFFRHHRFPIPNGCYSFLGVIAFHFHRYIPRLDKNPFQMSKLEISDKSLPYIFIFAMLLKDAYTLLLFAPGWYLGYLYCSTSLSSILLPQSLCSIFRLFHPLFDVVPASVITAQRQRRVMQAQQRNAAPLPANTVSANVQGQGFRDQLLPGANRVEADIPPISEEALMQLTALGFDRERALIALRLESNNVQAAANRLLNGM